MVDFNRGGTPLIEIVSEPDIPSPEAAREFLQQLRNLVVELGVSECNMEEGQIRWDANLSVRPAGSSELGTRTELKNMNSFRYLQQALDAEIPRQIEVLEAGGTIDQETLHFDPDTGTTTPLRSKEEAHDYRYFPEPDLVPLVIDPAWVEELRATQPELPAARVERFVASTACRATTPRARAAAAALARSTRQVGWRRGADAKLAANWTMGEYLAHLNAAGLEPGHGHVTAERLARAGRPCRRPARCRQRRPKRSSRSWSRSAPSRAGRRQARPRPDLDDSAELEAAVARVLADNPAQVAAVPRRQAAGAGLLRRPGHEDHRRPRQPAARQRAAAQGARQLTASTLSSALTMWNT